LKISRLRVVCLDDWAVWMLVVLPTFRTPLLLPSSRRSHHFRYVYYSKDLRSASTTHTHTHTHTQCDHRETESTEVQSCVVVFVFCSTTLSLICFECGMAVTARRTKYWQGADLHDTQYKLRG